MHKALSPSPTIPLLNVQNLCVSLTSEGYTRSLLRDVSFSLSQNRCMALVGESGSGKTMLAKAIMRLLPPTASITSGHIWFSPPPAQAQLASKGRGGLSRLATEGPIDLAALPVASKALRLLRGDGISFVFQEPMTTLSPLHTIGDQLSEVARLHLGASKAHARKLTAKMLDMVNFPQAETALDAYPFQLSGGLRQRAVIAMALLAGPSVLIADEPTTALDVTIQAGILALLRQMQQELQMALLLITHDFGVVANMADDITVLYHGEIMEQGDAPTLFTNPRHPYLRQLLGAVPTLHPSAAPQFWQSARQADKVSETALAPLPPLPNLENRQVPAAGTPLIKVEKASLSLAPLGRPRRQQQKRKPILRNISLELKAGECLGIVGESGSGKTTLALAMLRVHTLSSGRVLWRDQNTAPHLNHDLASLTAAQLKAFRRTAQMVFQDPFSALNPRMTIGATLLEPLVIHGLDTPRLRRILPVALMKLVGLEHKSLSLYPSAFSGGERQRIGIARALALGPQILICDEPTSALDVSVQAQVLALLMQLKRRLGLTYLFVSHNLAVIRQLCDRIAVMCCGRIVEIGPACDVITAPVHPYTQALIKAVPEPNPDHPLDFVHLAEQGASDPSAWASPYTLQSEEAGTLIQVAPAHQVLLSPRHAGGTLLAQGEGI